MSDYVYVYNINSKFAKEFIISLGGQRENRSGVGSDVYEEGKEKIKVKNFRKSEG